MALVFLLLGMFFPRVVILVLYFFTNWFSSAFEGILLPLLGFFILPISLLWYAIVIHYFGGQWSGFPLVGMIIAVAADLGVWRQSGRR